MSAVTRQLEKRSERVAELHGRVREVEHEGQAAIAKAAELRERLTEAYALDDAAAAAKLKRELAKADDLAAEPWAEKVAGAQRAASRAASERDAFLVERHHDLVRDREPAAEQAARDLQRALEAVLAAERRWSAEGAAVLDLHRPLDGSPRLEDHGVDDIVRDIRRRLNAGPIPTPRPRPPGARAHDTRS